MPFDYYCTYCGRKITHDTVLYDMQMLLTGNEQLSFTILKFRLTKAELEQLFNSGIPTSQGFRQCSIDMTWLANIMGNSNNLDDPQICRLTVEDIAKYCAVKDIPTNDSEPTKDVIDVFDLDDKAEEIELTPKAKIEEVAISEAILAIEKKDARNASEDYTQGDLRKDFGFLSGKFFVGEGANARALSYEFELSLLTENDSEGNAVLYGYLMKTGRNSTVIKQARVCPFCSKTSKVFDRAGTAQHRTVTFIGDQKAGKTCTILALTHYAERGLTSPALTTDQIWNGSNYMPSIANIQLLSPSDRLKKDLTLFGCGIAPQKTAAEKRDDAYSATFKIENRNSKDSFILTLTDLPGDLCKDDGTLKDNDIRNEFQIALACDVFVLCFDISLSHDLATINRACSWANEFQRLRAEYKKKTEQEKVNRKAAGNYAPMMVLFTKSPGLEANLNKVQNKKPNYEFDRIEMTYVFREERRFIDADEVCEAVGAKMDNFECLKTVYRARLRCSPYGFDAPKESDVKVGQINHPTPKNIPQLMRWILNVSGCAATDAIYRPSLDPKDIRCLEIPYNFIKRPQYRHECPAGKQDGDVAEALARCYLFENPGDYDKELLCYYDQTFVKARLRVEMRFKDNVQ